MRKYFFTALLLLIFSVSISAFEDHSDYVYGPFDNALEVTQVCIECHTEQAESFLHSVHWTLEDAESYVMRNGEKIYIGKKSVVNNFCIGLASNWPRCTSCHAGYGWNDKDFDLTDMKNIDCLVCHERTGTYKKSPAGAGMPVAGLDLETIAQSVGPTTNESCGACHFYGGGGNNVKHGDLDVALLDGGRDLDVHMSDESMGFECTECHKTQDHMIPGNALSLSTLNTELVSCENCHHANPHASRTLNIHFRSMACQTCHIPEYARANPTKLSWDWSRAGQDLTVEKDKYGMPTYDKKKGAFVWGKNLVPSYEWYDGSSERMVLGDFVKENEMNYISRPHGNLEDKDSKIYPFKIHTGKQVADKNYKYLLTPHLWNGYWSHFDWNKALEVGSEANGLKYSGEYTFVQTAMYWKINHMVAPKEEALDCVECHGPNQTRMDWEALGYAGGDPRKAGGRFSVRRKW